MSNKPSPPAPSKWLAWIARMSIGAYSVIQLLLLWNWPFAFITWSLLMGCIAYFAVRYHSPDHKCRQWACAFFGTAFAHSALSICTAGFAWPRNAGAVFVLDHSPIFILSCFAGGTFLLCVDWLMSSANEVPIPTRHGWVDPQEVRTSLVLALSSLRGWFRTHPDDPGTQNENPDDPAT